MTEFIYIYLRAGEPEKAFWTEEEAAKWWASYVEEYDKHVEGDIYEVRIYGNNR